MAQKTEKEETEFKVPETLTLCINNCGLTGNPALNNMCQKCFNASTTSTSNTSTSSTTTTTTMTATATTTPAGVSSGGILKFSGEKLSRSGTSRSPVKDPAPDQDKSGSDMARREVNRCSGCKRRVGLTGFRCRCGELFCWEHRYSDRHDCSYDYKAAGREVIARENPVVKAAKIVRV